MLGEREFLVVDTGGFEPVATTGILFEMAQPDDSRPSPKPTRSSSSSTRAQGLAPQDRAIADLLRRSGRPVVLAVNKAEGMPPERAVAEFHELGLGEPLADLRGARRERRAT